MLDSLPCSFTYIFFLTKQKKKKNMPQNMPIILNKTLFSLFRTKNYICNRIKDMAIVQVKVVRYIYYNFIFSKHFKVIAGK
jgi:hypothetical protein